MTQSPDNASELGARLLEGGAALRVAIAILIALVVTSVVSLMAAICWLFLVPAVLGPVSIQGNYSHRVLATLFNQLPNCALFVLAGFFIARKDLKKAFVNELGFKIDGHTAALFALGLAFGLGGAAVVGALYLVTGAAIVNPPAIYSFWEYFSGIAPMWLIILIGALASSIAYESFFRGYVQRTLTGSYHVFWGIAAAAIIAGMFKTNGFWVTLVTTLVSGVSMTALEVLSVYFVDIVVGIILLFAICGYLYYITGSLVLTIGFGFSYNFWNTVLNYNGVLYQTNPTSPQYGLIQILLSIAILGLLYVYHRMETERKGSVRDAISGALDRMTGSSGKP